MGLVTPQWAAGFFDGEGTVDIRVRRTHGGKYIRFEMRCQIAQRERHALDLIAAVYGGSVHFNGRCHAWVASSQVAVRFLRDIAPHLICKAAQADVALRYSALQPGRPGIALTQGEIDARLALQKEIRAIRDASGLRAKDRNHSLQAEAAVYAVSRDGKAVADHRGAQASGKDRGLH